MEENKNVRIEFLRKWWLHLLLLGAQGILGILLNYSLYKFVIDPAIICGTPGFGVIMLQCFMSFVVFIALLIRMGIGRGFGVRDYLFTTLLPFVQPLIAVFLFFF